MTILSTHESSRIRNAALSALHYIAYELHCEVPDILALLSQPSQSSQAPAARTSVPATPDVQAEESPHGFSATPSQAKTSEDGGTPAQDTETPADSVTGDASRPDAGRSASATSEIMDATGGESAASPFEPQPTSTPAVQAHIVPDGSNVRDERPTSQPGAKAPNVPAPITEAPKPLPLEEHRPAEAKTSDQADGGAVSAVKGKARLENADGVELPPSATPSKPKHRLASKTKATAEALRKAVEAETPPAQPTPPPKPKRQPAEPSGPKKTIKQQVMELHAVHPDWTSTQIAEHLGANRGTVSTALADATAEARYAAQAVEQAETERRLLAEAREREQSHAEPEGQKRTLTEKVRALHQQHPTWTASLIAKELGANPNSVSALLAGIRNPKATSSPEPKPEFSGRREMIEHYGEIAKRLGKPS